MPATPVTNTVPLKFSPENWFEIYYRLGCTWNKTGRELGCPDTILTHGKTVKHGDVLVFSGTTLLNIIEA